MSFFTTKRQIAISLWNLAIFVATYSLGKGSSLFRHVDFPSRLHAYKHNNLLVKTQIPVLRIYHICLILYFELPPQTIYVYINLCP